MAIRTYAQLCAIVILAGASVSRGAVVISDNFDDGNDTGWTRADPNNDEFNQSVSGDTYSSFDPSSGAYRIQAFPGPIPQSPSRAAAYRSDATYGDFSVSVDLVAFSTVNQWVGIVARLGDVGFNTTDGYLLNYNPSPVGTEGGALQIRRITDEGAATILGEANVNPPLSGAGDYRLVFTGLGSQFTGQLFDSTGGLIASTAAVDATHAGPGFAGLLVRNQTNANADATFDNFVAVPEPASLVLLGLAAAGLLLRRRRQSNG